MKGQNIELLSTQHWYQTKCTAAIKLYYYYYYYYWQFHETNQFMKPTILWNQPLYETNLFMKPTTLWNQPLYETNHLIKPTVVY